MNTEQPTPPPVVLSTAQLGEIATRPDEREAFEAMMRSQTFDSLKRLSDGSYESYEARVGWLAWNVRAAHGQAPAQAAPAAAAGPSGYGPKVTVRRSCSDCKACNSESYAVQGDSGHYVYCEHPSLPESKYIGDTHWDTPDWCPAAAPTTQPAAQDAERYRYLRDGVLVDGEVNEDLYVHVDHQSYPNRWALVGLELDEAIDAARAAQDGKQICKKDHL